MRILGREFRLGDPKSVDIVIFDECNSLYVRKALNPNYRIAIFKMRPYEILVGPKILINVVRFLRQLTLREAVAHPRGFVLGTLSQLRSIYFESCLVAMKPKAVVTFIDNSDSFHWLSRYCREFPFIAIQNGARLRYASVGTSGYYLQHLFCWGTHEPELFKQLGFEIENYYPVGSLLASLHFDQDQRMEPPKYDLLIVSAWRGNIGVAPDVQDTMRSMKIMDQLLARYVASRTIEAAIILRAERNSEDWVMDGIGTEYDYYQGIYGNSIEIIEADFVARTIYPAMQQSRLIVSCLSSALIEAYGIGKKVLYFNFTGINSYHCDLDPSIVTDEGNWEEFSQQLDDLLAQPAEEYRRLHKNNMQKMMSLPIGSSTHEAIAETIDQIIEGVPCHR